MKLSREGHGSHCHHRKWGVQRLITSFHYFTLENISSFAVYHMHVSIWKESDLRIWSSETFRIVGNRGKEDGCLCIVFLALDKQGSKARVDIISGFSLPYTGSGIPKKIKKKLTCACHAGFFRWGIKRSRIGGVDLNARPLETRISHMRDCSLTPFKIAPPTFYWEEKWGEIAIIKYNAN